MDLSTIKVAHRGHGLNAALPTIDLYWAVEPYWGLAQMQALDGMDYAAALQDCRAQGKEQSGIMQALGRLVGRMRGGYWDDDDDTDPDDRPYTVENGIAIIEITGPMLKRSSWWYSSTGTVMLRKYIRRAAADADVAAILIVVDSPGGQVSGTYDLAQEIANAGLKKPVMTYGEDQICSAAYWAGSQASDGLWCNQTCSVGSVGTLLVMEDSSKMAEEFGVRVVVIGSGEYKGIGVDGAPLTDKQVAYLRKQVLALNAQFTGAVQSARSLSADKMTEVAKAGVFIGEAAVDIGLVDGIATLDAVKAMLLQKAQARKPAGDRRSAASATRALCAEALHLEGNVHPGPIEATLGQLEESLKRNEKTAQEVSDKADGPPMPPAAIVECEEQDPVTRRLAQEKSSKSTAGEVPAVLLPGAIQAETDAALPPMQENAALSGRGEKGMLKEKLVRALSAFKLNRMAVAVVGETNEDPETLVAAMAAQVEAEVKDRLDNHPLMMACAAVSIRSVPDLETVLTMRALGESYLAELRSEAKAAAIRAFDAENGPRISAAVDTMAARDVKALRDAWNLQADKTFEINARQGAERVSAPRHNPEALNATGTEEANMPRTAWDQLTPPQQKLAAEMGIKTPEQKEKWAQEYLDTKARAVA